MAEAAAAIVSEREALDRALAADPKNAGLHVKRAQLEARIWSQTPAEADLTKLVEHLDLALETLPEVHRPQLLNFAVQLQQRGAGLAPLLKTGQYQRLLALVTRQPLPPPVNGPRAETAPRQTPAPPGEESTEEPEPSQPERSRALPAEPNGVPPETTPAEPTPQAEPPRTRTPTPLPTRRAKSMSFNEVEVGEVTNSKIKTWLDSGHFAELASAYPVLDNFRTRRLIIDKVSEKPSPAALTALVHMLCHEHDEKSIAYVTKKIIAFDPEMIVSELKYEPTDIKYKLAVITVFAAMKHEKCVKPLTQALRDKDVLVRGKAVDGLATLVKPTTDWLKQLARIAGEDKDAGVRMSAARALQTIDSEDAFREFNAISLQRELDKNVKMVLDEMSAKFLKAKLGESRAKRAEEQSKERKKKAKKLSGVQFNFKQYLALAGVVITMAVVAFLVWNKIQTMMDPTGARRRLMMRR